MSPENRNELKKTLLHLAKNGGTGTPVILAKKLGIGERSVKRMVSELRDDGHEIVYSRYIDSYIIRE
jgi:biotin operon repressor